MRLQFLQINLDWPQDLSPLDLRKWILNHLKEFGEPLRWAITKTNKSSNNLDMCQITIEAVVIQDDFS